MKRTLVLLHGVASNSIRWSEFVAHTRLKENWKLLCPDLRGNGSAAFPRTRVGMDLWCADIAALVYAVARVLNSLGLYRRRLEPLDLQQLDRATRSGELRLSRFASPLLDLKTTPVAAYFRMLAATAEPWPDVAAIRVPVLALVSARSGFTDPGRTRRALAALPDCEVVEIDAVHWIPTEQPEAMRATIEDWLGRRLTASP